MFWISYSDAIKRLPKHIINLSFYKPKVTYKSMKEWQYYLMYSCIFLGTVSTKISIQTSLTTTLNLSSQLQKKQLHNTK